jgi:hypothetical protein
MGMDESSSFAFGTDQATQQGNRQSPRTLHLVCDRSSLINGRKNPPANLGYHHACDGLGYRSVLGLQVLRRTSNIWFHGSFEDLTMMSRSTRFAFFDLLQ